MGNDEQTYKNKVRKSIVSLVYFLLVFAIIVQGIIAIHSWS